MWYDLKGFNGKYQITKDGQVRSTEMVVWNGRAFHTKPGRIKTQFTSKAGYKCVTLSKDNKGKNYLIHRLLAETFIPNLENKPCIDHINGNKLDNSLDNLRWCTHKENCNNENTKCYGENQSMYGTHLSKERIDKLRKINFKKVICLNNNNIFNSLEEAKIYISAKDTTGISSCCKNKRFSCGTDKLGNRLTWMYYDEFLSSNDEFIKLKLEKAKNSKNNSLSNLKPRKSKGVDNAAVLKVVKSYKVNDVKDLTKTQYEEICKRLESK